jgi:hypothetical protein
MRSLSAVRNHKRPGIQVNPARPDVGYLLTSAETKADKRGADLTDSDVRTILVHAMADLGADPALVYAF